MSDETVRIGLLGRGTVGDAFHDLVLQRADAIRAAAGSRPEIVGVLRRSEGDFDQILDDSDVVVELIGGIDPAHEYVLKALQAGRHVVTANKQLIAQFGDELFAAARQHRVQLRFEAAVAGVVPVVRVIQESLAATEITKVFGIVNGTTNFILTEMATTGATYEDALRRAQELGYAEADPTDDVGGGDAAAKMAILARLAFGAPVRLADVAFDGITEIQPGSFAFMDAEYAGIGGPDGAEYRDFSQALTVIATVISRRPGVAIVDTGYKAFATDRPFTPAPIDLPGVTYGWAGDEHGRLDLSASDVDLRTGDRVAFVPPHCDPTVNLYDVIHAVRGDQVEAIWPIAARGKSQ